MDSSIWAFQWACRYFNSFILLTRLTFFPEWFSCFQGGNVNCWCSGFFSFCVFAHSFVKFSNVFSRWTNKSWTYRGLFMSVCRSHCFCYYSSSSHHGNLINGPFFFSRSSFKKGFEIKSSDKVLSNILKRNIDEKKGKRCLNLFFWCLVF